jgi:hypothetical protein
MTATAPVARVVLMNEHPWAIRRPHHGLSSDRTCALSAGTGVWGGAGMR